MLEANAIPGLTDTSLLPLAAEAAGSFDDADRADRRGRSSRRLAVAPPAGRREALAVPPPAKSSGRDLVEELLELVDDLLGVLDLVLELDRRLGDHVLGGEDRGAGAHGEGERVDGRESISTSRPFTDSVIDA